MINELSVVIPAFNEESAIVSVLEELQRRLLDLELSAEILVVDDGSTDSTAEAAMKAGAKVLQHRSNRGYGAALKTGITAASHDVVVIVDADGTYPLDYLGPILAELDHADMVVAARTGAEVKVPWIRRPAKWVLNRLAEYVSGSEIPDLNSGFRAFRRDVVMQYFSLLPDQFSWTSTLTMAMHCDHYAVRYVPIDYRTRQGKSKIVALDAGGFAILILRTAMLFRPLRVFIPLVVVCLTYGVVKLIIDLAVVGDRNISASALLMLLSALVILLIGMLGDAIAARLGRLSPNAVVGVQSQVVTEFQFDSDRDSS